MPNTVEIPKMVLEQQYSCIISKAHLYSLYNEKDFLPHFNFGILKSNNISFLFYVNNNAIESALMEAFGSI